MELLEQRVVDGLAQSGTWGRLVWLATFLYRCGRGVPSRALQQQRRSGPAVLPRAREPRGGGRRCVDDLARDVHQLTGLAALGAGVTITAVTGLLMMSRFAYMSFKDVNPGKRVRFAQRLLILLVLIVRRVPTGRGRSSGCSSSMRPPAPRPGRGTAAAQAPRNGDAAVTRCATGISRRSAFPFGAYVTRRRGSAPVSKAETALEIATPAALESAAARCRRMVWSCRQVPACTLCGLHRSRTQTVFGVGDATRAGW